MLPTFGYCDEIVESATQPACFAIQQIRSLRGTTTLPEGNSSRTPVHTAAAAAASGGSGGASRKLRRTTTCTAGGSV